MYYSNTTTMTDTQMQTDTTPLKTIVFALPGDHFSGKFLMSWTNTINQLYSKYKIIITNNYSSYVPFSRMKCLGLDNLRGEDQKPFDGKIDYDVWVTIDSDMVFSAEQVVELIESTEEHPIVSGVYMMQDVKHLCIVKDWDTKYFLENGHFEYLTASALEEWKKENKSDKYMKVSYTGMGFFAVRKDVFEKLKYPYFHRDIETMKKEDGTIVRDVCSEDVALCRNLTDAGFDIVVNANLRVGHEKSLVV